MADWDDVRRIALALPETDEHVSRGNVHWRVREQLCFTMPHFDGYPAVLVRLDATGMEELEELIAEAWLSRAPRRLAREWLEGRGG